ncbi:glucokinase [Asticcacaulis sp. AC402]|uniref:glucokinase n=1 Tax=Asticcacaulis sp. AC402 TaxID=1282361 RepID=UPI0003C3F4AB|nr:glucokinase [Asticcacaulis sp. AC402]ESQ75811.1 glucokinase [Asticcacaulis sp. AC402]
MGEFVLLSDISNGICLKLALARRGERPDGAEQFPCETWDDFQASIRYFLKKHDNPVLMGAAISAGGWEHRGTMAMPNHRFTLNRAEVREFLNIQRLNLVNDCVAKALAIPRLDRSERLEICGGEALEEQVIAVISTHRGLGQAALAPDGMGNWTAMPCEGGHSDLTPVTDLEWRVWQILHEKYNGHVSRERVVSIPGLRDLWQALARLDGEDGATVPEAELIVSRARIGDARCRQVVDLSMGWFAAFASDVALILGARGGVYLAGDLMDMIGDQLDVDAFVTRYSDKGRLSTYVREIPVYRATARDLEVIGLATLFD